MRMQDVRNQITAAERGLFDWRMVYSMLGGLEKRLNGANYQQKQAFLRVLCPDGLVLQNGVVRTTDKPFILNALRQKNRQK